MNIYMHLYGSTVEVGEAMAWEPQETDLCEEAGVHMQLNIFLRLQLILELKHGEGVPHMKSLWHFYWKCAEMLCLNPQDEENDFF